MSVLFENPLFVYTEKERERSVHYRSLKGTFVHTGR